MDDLLNLLLNLLKVATARRGTALTIVPPADMLAELLVGSALAPEQERLGSLIHAAGAGQLGLAACLSHLVEIAQRCAPQDAQRAQFEARWSAAATTLDRLLMFNALLEWDCALHTSFAFDDSAMFDFVQSLAIEAGPGGCTATLVATIPPSSGELQITGEADLLRRITIAYRCATDYPLLSVRIPSTTPHAPRQGTRLNWQQRETPAYDLSLYNFNHRLLGQVITRRVHPPYELPGRKLTIAFSEHADVELLVTDIVNTSDERVGRYVKVLRHD